MVKFIFILGVAALASFTDAFEKIRRGHQHQHHARATAVASVLGYTNLYANKAILPSFADCINYKILSSATNAAQSCAAICNSDSTCNFFAFYNTASAPNAPWCGWWTDVFTSKEINQEVTDQGEAITNAYGYKKGTAAVSTTLIVATTAKVTTAKVTTNSKTSSSSLKTSITSTKPASTSKTTSTSTKKSSTSTKTTTSSSAKKTSTTKTFTKTTTTTTLTATSSSGGLPGYYMAYAGPTAIPSDDNCINYYYAVDNGDSAPVQDCAAICDKTAGCVFFTTWIQTGFSSLYNCAIYDVAYTSGQLTVTTANNGGISAAIGFTKGIDPNTYPVITSYKTSSTCGVPAWISDTSLVFDSFASNIATIDLCRQYCVSVGCTTFEFQPSVSTCVTYNSDVFSRISEDDKLANSYFYNVACDTSSSVVGPTFKSTRLTATQRATRCGVNGNAVAGAYQVSFGGTSSSEGCGIWCYVYPVFFSYAWTNPGGKCVCYGPTLDNLMTENTTSSVQFYSIDCVLSTFLYTGLSSV